MLSCWLPGSRPSPLILNQAFPLRIALLAGCLEPGRDGVGDYTPGLAAEAVATGAPILTVALHDPFVTKVECKERAGVVVLRLPAEMPWAARLRHARKALDEFDPDWVSLQFVPYSFHPRGWTLGLARRLRPLLARPARPDQRKADRHLHVMFHELWLGGGAEASWKHRAEGLWQRWLILRFLRAMRPSVVHTSNPTYAHMLREAGVKAAVLPLFGSIPLDAPEAAREEAEAWWAGELASMSLSAEERQSYWVFGVFGSIHREWWPGELFTALLAQPPTLRRSLALVTIGRSGPAGEEVLRRLEHEFAGVVRFRHLGEQPPARVATVFRHLDFGISTSPWALIGKSSSAAAMREHGVPVIVTRVDDSTPSVTDDDSLLKFDAALPAKLGAVGRRVVGSYRPKIVRRWYAALERTKL